MVLDQSISPLKEDLLVFLLQEHKTVSQLQVRFSDIPKLTDLTKALGGLQDAGFISIRIYDSGSEDLEAYIYLTNDGSSLAHRIRYQKYRQFRP